MSQRSPRAFVVPMVLLFLSLSCKQNLNQNNTAESKQPEATPSENSISIVKNPETQTKDKPSITDTDIKKSGEPFFASILAGTSPTLIYGTEPKYIKIEKASNTWEAMLTDLPDQEHPDQDEDKFRLRFPIQTKAKKSINLSENKTTNAFGLYFGSYPLTQSKIVCDSRNTKCVKTERKDFVIVRTQKDQFDSLLSQAKEIDVVADPSTPKDWNLYLFDSEMTLQGKTNAKLVVTPGDDKKTKLDFNLNNAIKTADPSSIQIKLQIISLEKHMVVGTITTTENEYRVIGIELLNYKTQEEAQKQTDAEVK